MATTIHLTNDNGKSAFSKKKNALGAIDYDDKHLVVIKQKTAWSSKEIVVTPDFDQLKQFGAWAAGEEKYSTTQGGSNVKNDTDQLINAVQAKLNTAIWSSPSSGTSLRSAGLYAIYSRSDGPYVHELKRAGVSWATATGVGPIADCGMNVVCQMFNMRHLHFSKMSSFKAYLRVWNPSLVTSSSSRISLENAGYIIAGGLYNSASQLHMRFATSMPEKPAYHLVEASGYDSWEMGNNCNNQVVTKDTFIQTAMIFNPFGADRGYPTSKTDYLPVSSRVYQSNIASPIAYYKDFEITNTENLATLKKNPGKLYMLASFNLANAFSSGTASQGLNSFFAATLYAERFELVFKCSSARFNN